MNTTNYSAIQLSGIEAFCRAAEFLSFAKAAEHLGVTPAAISRNVARLEARLRTQLFVRTTRKIALTVDGTAYYEQCREALELLTNAERVLEGERSRVSGRVRVSMPTTYAHFRILPLLPKLLAKYPDLVLDLDVSNRNIDFYDENFDLAIRMGEPQDSRMIARKLENAPLALYASRSYLRKRSAPDTIADLSRHRCLHFVLPSTGRVLPWLLREKGETIERAFDDGVRIGGDPLAAVRLAASGGGIVQTFRWIAESSDFPETLTEVLPSANGATRAFHLLYPQPRHLSQRVRAVIDLLVLHLHTQNNIG
jgi:DNA-binding transcriptional LysR family regulator